MQFVIIRFPISLAGDASTAMGLSAPIAIFTAVAAATDVCDSLSAIMGFPSCCSCTTRAIAQRTRKGGKAYTSAVQYASPNDKLSST